MVQYSSESLATLNKVRCNRCKLKLPNWDDEIYKCWLLYINGADRQKLIKGSRFTLYVSPRYYFRKHPCYREISSVRKTLFRSVKTRVRGNLVDHPWLLGLYYADGFLRNRKSQLAFALGKNEKLIANQVRKELRKLLYGSKLNIAKDLIGNMLQIRIHSRELGILLPEKKNKKQFKKLWTSFNRSSKIKFIAGFIDGDGSCQYDVGINSVQIYSKLVPFVLKTFKKFLAEFGYVSLKDYRLYLSPTVGTMLKPYTEKRRIKVPYGGKIDAKTAFELMRNGLPMREIARRFHRDRKTITIALKKIYEPETIQHYLDLHNTKLHPNG